MELADDVDLGLPCARARVLSGLVEGWKTIRLTSSFLCVGVAGIIYSYYKTGPWTWPSLFLLLSVVFSVTSFISSNMLIFCFADWSGDTKKLEEKAGTWSTVFCMPGVSVIWGLVSLLSAGVIFTLEKTVIKQPIFGDNSHVMFNIFLAVPVGIAITLLFYMFIVLCYL
jgi:hypothetical protein